MQSQVIAHTSPIRRPVASIKRQVDQQFRGRLRMVGDGPLAHLPSGHFGANSAWALCAAIAHNLLHTAGTLAGEGHAVARGATLRRRLITVPARLARPARTPVLHLPSRWPWAPAWLRLWTHTIGLSPPVPA